MATPALQDTLLETGGKQAMPIHRRTVLFTGVFTLLAGSVGFYVGTLYGATGDSEMPIPSAALNNTVDLDLAAYSADCYGYTGGTCVAAACNLDRNAECQDLKCICTNGCTGADGRCRPHRYRKIASKVSFTNDYWSDYWLYMQRVSLLGQLKVSKMPAEFFQGSQGFDLYELPGQVEGRKQYLMASSKWLDHVAAIRSTGSLLTLSASLFGLYSVSLHSTIPYDPQGITLHICKVMKGPFPDSSHAVMFQHYHIGGERSSAYIHRGSDFVYGYTILADPGPGGYWIPSTPIDDLQEC